MTNPHRAHTVFEHRSHHAEGPLWDADRQELIWVDQYRGQVLAGVTPGAVRVVTDLGVPVGAIVPATTAPWIVAAGNGFALVHHDGTATAVADVLPSDGVSRRMNDGKVGPDGSMATDKRAGAGTLYRLSCDQPQPVLTGLTISNGLAWSSDGTAMFFIDTPTGAVRRYRLTDDGLPTSPVTVVQLDSTDGAPDGMCIDVEDHLWIAVWGAGEVRRYDDTGRLVQRVSVEAPQVSSCCFGGDDLTTLFITTSQEGYTTADSEHSPSAGRIFAFETDTRGAVPARYHA